MLLRLSTYRFHAFCPWTIHHRKFIHCSNKICLCLICTPSHILLNSMSCPHTVHTPFHLSYHFWINLHIACHWNKTQSLLLLSWIIIRQADQNRHRFYTFLSWTPTCQFGNNLQYEVERCWLILLHLLLPHREIAAQYFWTAFWGFWWAPCLKLIILIKTLRGTYAFQITLESLISSTILFYQIWASSLTP